MTGARTKPNDPRYREKRAALKRFARAKNLPCWLCGRDIDWTATAGQPESFTADHVTPTSKGGSQTGPLRPAHHGCNSRRGNRAAAYQTLTEPIEPW